MTKDSVLNAHRDIFYRALLTRDWDTLSELYADDYRLVRSNGAVLTKDEVLTDLKTGGLVFISIDLTRELLQVDGSLAVLTGESRTIVERRGNASESRFRLVAVYVEVEGVIRLLYFQSTDLPSDYPSDNSKSIEAIEKSSPIDL
jgi:hypothetical protein